MEKNLVRNLQHGPKTRLIRGISVDITVLVFLIFIHWIAFYPMDSANNHKQTFMLVNKFDGEGCFIHIQSDRNDKKIFIGLPVVSQ